MRASACLDEGNGEEPTGASAPLWRAVGYNRRRTFQEEKLMRWIQLVSVMALGFGLFVGGARGQVGGVRGVVDNKLKGVDEHNEALNEAMNDALGGRENRPAEVVAPDAL